MNMVKDLFYSQQTLFTLFSVTNKLQIAGDKYLQDLTIRQILALPALFHAPEGKATINHIARSMGTSKQNAKQIVDAMERKGYLSVAPSEQDKRALHVSITLEGEQAFRACSERFDEFLATIFQNFTSEELETICMLLQKLYSFDGSEQENFEHKQHHTNEDEGLQLQFHQNFVRLRKNKYKKEE